MAAQVRVELERLHRIALESRESIRQRMRVIRFHQDTGAIGWQGRDEDVDGRA